MTFAPPSTTDQPSAPIPPPPASTTPGWYRPSAPSPDRYRPVTDHGRPNWFRAAMVAVPLIGIGASAFYFMSARNDAKEISDRALDVVESAVQDISVPEVATPVVTVPATPAAPVTVAATIAAPLPAPAPESVVAVTAPASGAIASGSVAAVPVADLWSPEGSAAVVAAYESALSGEPTRFLDLLIYDTYAFATAQDAAIPTHVDEYPFRNGAIGTSTPVELLGDGDLESSLWSLADVDISQIPRLVAEAPGLTAIEEPEIVYVRIERSVFHDGFPVTMKVYLDGPRGSGYVEYDAAGNLIQVVA